MKWEVLEGGMDGRHAGLGIRRRALLEASIHVSAGSEVVRAPFNTSVRVSAGPEV